MPYWQAAAAVVGGLISAKGSRDQNSSAANLNRENRDWQRYMSNTAHQRQVKDLMAAGLNPILSAKSGGASTPTGGVPPVVNELEGVSNTAINFLTMKQNLDNMQAENENKKQQTVNLKTDNDKKIFEAQIEKDKYEQYLKFKEKFFGKSDTDRENSAKAVRKKHNLPPVEYFTQQELRDMTKGRKPDPRKKN